MRLLVVDDSALVRSVLKDMFREHRSSWELVGEAKNGAEAVSMAQALKPDLILMDQDMPIKTGLEATQEIMQAHPVPIIIFSNKTDAIDAFRAVKQGASEILKKPTIDAMNSQDFAAFFLSKIEHVYKYFSFSRNVRELVKKSEGPPNPSQYQIILIGTSTGGPAAVHEIFSAIPKKLRLPIVLVQHLEDGFDESYVSWLDGGTPLEVELAQEGLLPQAGVVYVAPTGSHLEFRQKRLHIDKGEPLHNQRPSVDKLFYSAAREYGPHAIAFLLTGMGRDGAEGLLAIKEAGGLTVAQDEASSAIFGMPKEAIQRGAAKKVLSLAEITEWFQSFA